MSPSDEAPDRRGPVADEDSAPFWAALRRHEIVLQRCAACGETRFPPMPACPYCGQTQTEVVASSGRGRIYSWIVAHVPVGSLTVADLPCTIVTVELDEGCRLLGRLDSSITPAIDLRVSPVFVDRDGWTELAFAAGEET